MWLVKIMMVIVIDFVFIFCFSYLSLVVTASAGDCMVRLVSGMMY